MTVPVQYQRGDPDWNRLLMGEQEGSHLGGKFLFLSGGLTLFVGILGIVSLAGFDLKTENGQFVIVRRGSLLKSFGRSTAAPGEKAFQSLPTPIASTKDTHTAPAAPIPRNPSAPRRPPGINALGILGLAFGGLGVLMGGIRLLLMRAQTLDIGRQTYVIEASTIQRCWWSADGFLAVLLMIAGIGLLRVRKWGRLLGIVAALLQVLSSIAGTVVAAIALGRVPAGSGPESGHAVAAGIGVVITQFLTGIFPAILLFILVRRGTAYAFEASERALDSSIAS